MKLEKIHEEGMIPGEKGILGKKGIYFHSPGQFARNNLFCIYWGAEYLCGSPYQVSREGLNSLLLFCFLSGEMEFAYRGRTFTAGPGDVVILDCRLPHRYHAEKPVRFHFLHFDGVPARAYCELLYAKSGACFSGHPECALQSQRILEELSGERADDHRLSALFHQLMSTLASDGQKTFCEPVAKAVEYMQKHFQNPVTVDDIARQSAVSKFHLSRIFRAETGSSPHEYLTRLRLHHAQELIMETSKSIDFIASECGFSSTSHFIRAFKKEMDFTPAVYRKFFDSTGFSKSNPERMNYDTE